MDIKTDLFLNQLAQGVRPIADGVHWFTNIPSDTQPAVLRRLVFFLLQAGATSQDVERAIALSKLKHTFTPCQLARKAATEDPLGNRKLREALAKFATLPHQERIKSFRLLIALFSIAHRRRQLSSPQSEDHWWHQDLSDEEVIERILNRR